MEKTTTILYGFLIMNSMPGTSAALQLAEPVTAGGIWMCFLFLQEILGGSRGLYNAHGQSEENLLCQVALKQGCSQTGLIIAMMPSCSSHGSVVQ